MNARLSLPFVAPASSRVSAKVLGTARVRYDDLALKLGRVPTLVWRILLRDRHPETGVTFMTQQQIERAPGFERVPVRHVKNALARLREAHLVETLGWRLIDGDMKFARRVLGAVQLARDVALVPVPVETAKWVASASTWGGKREGAGAKRAAVARVASVSAGDSSGANPYSSGANPSNDTSQDECGSAVCTYVLSEPPKSGERAIESSGATFTLGSLNSSSASSLREEPAAAPAGHSSGDAMPARRSLIRSIVDPSLVDLSDVVAETPAGASIGGSARPETPHLVALGAPHPLVPPMTSLARLAPVVVPSPPKLDPLDPPERHVALLMRWLEGAVESRYNKRCWLFRSERVAPALSRYYKQLVEAAKVFIDQDIPPAAWCAFSVDVWLQYGSKKRQPPVAWIFAKKRIEERAGWFARELNDYTGGRIVYTDAAKELMRRQARLQYALRGLTVTATDADIARVVDAHLPESLRVDLVERAKLEAADLNDDLRIRAASGAWLW